MYHVYVCTYACMCGHMSMGYCMWRPHVDVRILHPLLFYQFTEAGSVNQTQSSLVSLVSLL